MSASQQQLGAYRFVSDHDVNPTVGIGLCLFRNIEKLETDIGPAQTGLLHESRKHVVAQCTGFDAYAASGEFGEGCHVCSADNGIAAC